MVKSFVDVADVGEVLLLPSILGAEVVAVYWVVLISTRCLSQLVI